MNCPLIPGLSDEKDCQPKKITSSVKMKSDERFLLFSLPLEEGGEVGFSYVAEEDGKGHQVATLH